MFKTPRQLPSLADMIDNIPADRRTLARHLGITERTLTRYIKGDSAPRPVQLALFWETKWGRSTADAEAATFAQLAAQRAMSSEEQNAILKSQLATMEDLIPTNAPYFEPGRRMTQERRATRTALYQRRIGASLFYPG